MSTAAIRHEARAERVAMLQMCVVALFWGMFFVFGKLAVNEASALVVASLRFWLAGVVLLGLLVWREPASLRVPPRDWPLALGLGATGVVAYNLLTFWGFGYAPTSDGSMLNPMVNPVVTAFLAAWLFKEPLTRHKLTGLLVAATGLALIFVGPIWQASGHDQRLLGDGLFVAASLVWSAYTLLGKLAAGRFSPLASTTYATWCGALLLLPFAWGDLSRLAWGGLSPTFWAAIGVLGLLSTVAAFLMWYGAIRTIGASRTATFHMLVPLVGVGLGWAVLGDVPTPLQGVGMMIAMAGVYWANRPGRG